VRHLNFQEELMVVVYNVQKHLWPDFSQRLPFSIDSQRQLDIFSNQVSFDEEEKDVIA